MCHKRFGWPTPIRPRRCRSRCYSRWRRRGDTARPTAGTGTPTRDYGIGATDLCAFMEFPSGVLQVCGDSFPGQGWASARGSRRSHCTSTPPRSTTRPACTTSA
ncbi:hypothetical protein I553_2876 [Mycobacterium xenopi 4042]|uniref:Uncharacterized protein n=1 Tax=Mycobacterium xenopi 4042 TaxID=1299334 RepID=X8EEF6_MYCXE|nr:hypothetical protein I553_2876 [Mycobacterium xenopi 4042]